MSKRVRTIDIESLRERARQKTVSDPLDLVNIQERLTNSAYKAYLFIMSQWMSFSTEILLVPMDTPHFQQAPTTHEITLFLEWLAMGRDGLLEDNITDTTVLNRLNCLKRAIKLHTQYIYTSTQNQDMVRFVTKDLVLRGLVSTSARSKPLAPIEVAKDIIKFLFACDEYQNLHSRMRIQLVFAIQLLLLTGVRPGEIIESDAWSKSNEGLLYKDIDLVYSQSSAYTGWLLYIKIRNRKGHREYKKHAPIIILCEEPEERHMCPVTSFLSLAFADDVFSELDSYQKLAATKPRAGSSIYKARYKAEALTRPVMRGMLADGAISTDRIWTYDCFNFALKGAGQRASYQENLTGYCFRRGFARSVEKQATAAQRRMLMGHKGEDTAQFYISGFVGIDSQSMVNGREQRLELYNESISMMANRNLLIPKPPGATLVETLYAKTELPPSDTLGDLDKNSENIVTTLPLSADQEYQIRRQSRYKQYRKNREAFIEGTSELAKATTLPTSAEILRRPSRYLQALFKFEPDRKAAVDLMFDENGASRPELPLGKVLEPLIKLANPQKKRYAYKTAEPIEGNRCSDCKTILAKSSPKRMHSHLLQCARKRRIKREREKIQTCFENIDTCLWNDCYHRFNRRSCGSYSLHVDEHLKEMEAHQCLWDQCAQSFGDYKDLAAHISIEHGVPNEWTIPTKMHYCYEHNVWCHSERMWNEHLQRRHLELLNSYCGIIEERGVVVVAAHCLFCLGGYKPLSVRFTQFPDVFRLHKHMKEHIGRNGIPTVCPHPQCDDVVGSSAGFWSHAISVHGVPPFGACNTTRKRKAAEISNDSSDTQDV